ncbi:MAG: JmjC domain-containing protein [Burkholderiaceae bacterium]
MPAKSQNQTPTVLLGGISPDEFCRAVWHKKPLLIRQAIPGFSPLLSSAELFELAHHETVESRLITAFSNKWQMKHGPFTKLPARGKPGWTLLVQGVDQHSDAVHALMERFTFIERARLDDVMISYASDGGGVGAHFDSYDVFLLQAAGRRRWRISTQKDLSLVEGMPLKILKNFKPSQEWVLEPGDMLYLPPHVAHEGVAVGDDCMTYSIGFRAAGRQETMSALLDDLQDVMQLEGQFDNAQRVAATPESTARLPDDLLDQLETLVKRQWPSRSVLTDFLGRALTEPKQSADFPARRGSLKYGVALARATRALFAPGWFFINGESWKMAGDDAKRLTLLAQQRALSAAQLQGASAALSGLLDEWRQMGWIVPAKTRSPQNPKAWSR